MTTSIAEVQRAISYATASGNKVELQELRQLEKHLRAQQRAQVADERERKQQYLLAREGTVEVMNEELRVRMDELSGVLTWTLNFDDRIDFDKLRKTHNPEPFTPGALAEQEPAPDWSSYEPTRPSRVVGLFKGRQYRSQLADAQNRFERDTAQHKQQEENRLAALAASREAYGQRMWEERREIDEHNNEVERLRTSFNSGEPSGVVEYFDLVLSKSKYPGAFPHKYRISFVPESKQLVIEYDLPSIDIVPSVKSYRFIKVRDEIASTARPVKELRATYAGLIAQITLRTIHEVFEADVHSYLDTVVFSGMVAQTDPATGNFKRPCVVSVRTTRDTFENLNLTQVDPVACLRNLKASISRSPEELTPVKPIVEFDMIDKRFVEETDVLADLEHRQNLLDLTPTEFEGLIQNLFGQIGLDAKLTRPSRDGGVDCVAYDTRPIFGGKVVIQAKRYRNTVDVSAVRDLFGTMQNEGANKGILVTTSGYGAASHEFASGKPLELIDGGQLLYLLKEHLDLDARIVLTE